MKRRGVDNPDEHLLKKHLSEMEKMRYALVPPAARPRGVSAALAGVPPDGGGEGGEEGSGAYGLSPWPPVPPDIMRASFVVVDITGTNLSKVAPRRTTRARPRGAEVWGGGRGEAG